MKHRLDEEAMRVIGESLERHAGAGAASAAGGAAAGGPAEPDSDL